MTTSIQPILQFGTSRFLLAHVDLFVSQALDAGETGQALGGITVVQTTTSAASARRVAALAGGAPYPVRIRGLRDQQAVDQEVRCHAVRDARQAHADWPGLLATIAGPVRVIVSNTADQGYRLDALDTADCISPGGPVPRSFPAKLCVLLHHRWQHAPQTPLSLYPCELIERNGDTLRDLVVQLAADWGLPQPFAQWLREHCVWANSLVDRIVSEALEPVGAVAEPYALWAIERQDRLVLPCRHEAIVVTDDLAHFAQLKLFLLNGGHSVLAERWLRDARPADETVVQAMADSGMRAELEAVWAQEILPVFDALGRGRQALDYVDQVRERLLNPFLAHRLADIAQNHAQKKQRRFAPLLALAEQHGLDLPQVRLRAALAAAD